MVMALQSALEELEDAGNELMLSDDDNVRFVIGECLVQFDKDAAETRLEQVRGAMSHVVLSRLKRSSSWNPYYFLTVARLC